MMNKKAYLEQIDLVNARGKYHPDWDSLAARPVPGWYAGKRLGIFLHWGPFSVPAYHDWYARNMYIKDSPEYKWHLEHYGDHKSFGFKDFIPSFTMERYDPAEWIRLFREAGADYVVPVAEHHDGFQNYKSELSRWNAFDMGPGRDIMGDLLLEAERAGMTAGASSHRVEHWFFQGHGRDFDSDVNTDLAPGDYYWPARKEPANHHDLFSEPAPDDEFLTDWLLRCCEIVDRYRPLIMYFDWWVQHSAVRPYMMRFAAYYYNRSEQWGGGVINYKHDALPWGIGVPDIERGQFAEAKPFLWQSDTSVMRNSWCYSQFGVYKPPREILWDLIDAVSKNGRLLLNFGPKSDGTFTGDDLNILGVMRDWMKDNDEAIHSTSLWRIPQEGPTRMEEGQFSDGKARDYTPADIRFTCRGSAIYAMVMKCPADGKIRIESLREADASKLPLWHGIIRDVQVLGLGAPAAWRRDGQALHVDLGDWRTSLPLTVKVVTV